MLNILEEDKDCVRRHISDTITHKYFFIQSCLKMLDYLYECDRYEDALELARRCSAHDHSKLEDDEVSQFIKLPIEEYGNKKHKEALTNDQKELIKLHWSRNRHHPEYFKSYCEMNEIDILEMVCDWAARSKQFETPLIPYIVETQRKRFGFDDDFFDKIMNYCQVVND